MIFASHNLPRFIPTGPGRSHRVKETKNEQLSRTRRVYIWHESGLDRYHKQEYHYSTSYIFDFDSCTMVVDFLMKSCPPEATGDEEDGSLLVLPPAPSCSSKYPVLSLNRTNDDPERDVFLTTLIAADPLLRAPRVDHKKRCPDRRFE